MPESSRTRRKRPWMGAVEADVYVFPTGRRLFALSQVASRAKTQGFAELAKHCEGAVAHDR